jgi:hypothetical protein
MFIACYISAYTVSMRDPEDMKICKFDSKKDAINYIVATLNDDENIDAVKKALSKKNCYCKTYENNCLGMWVIKEL